jgi:hypothetical protein
MLRSVAIGVLGGLTMAGAAHAGELKVQRSDLPLAVERTVAAQHADAERGFSKEMKNGQDLYEAELTVKGRRRDLLIDATGKIIEIEEEVSLAGLPAAVQLALKTLARDGRIVNVESITKQDQVVGYEAVVERKGKRTEVLVGPNGKPQTQAR